MIEMTQCTGITGDRWSIRRALSEAETRCAPL